MLAATTQAPPPSYDVSEPASLALLGLSRVDVAAMCRKTAKPYDAPSCPTTQVTGVSFANSDSSFGEFSGCFSIASLSQTMGSQRNPGRFSSEPSPGIASRPPIRKRTRHERRTKLQHGRMGETPGLILRYVFLAAGSKTDRAQPKSHDRQRGRLRHLGGVHSHRLASTEVNQAAAGRV